MKKLWDKGIKLNQFIEAFETKDDLLLDQKLLPYDLEASSAHAKMLQKLGFITKTELKKLELGLNEIAELNKKGKFKLQFGDEDIHTKIENYLTQKYTEAGEKIHTARSRNDQVLTALRLYTKAELALVKLEAQTFSTVLKKFNEQYGHINMPGYTHMQKAMPSSIGMWSQSFIDSLVDDLMQIDIAIKLVDQSPLGSAAGYGLPIKIDKQLTTRFLGFSKVQQNPIYCQNSRGKFEAAVLASLISVLMTINKLASDILLFTTSEFNFFKISDSLTTGSSIMPQKRNIDIAELLRNKVHLVLGNYTQVVSLSSNLPSGYNRDLQDSKKPLMESLETTQMSLKAAQILVKNLKPNEPALKSAMTDDLYATEKVYTLVKQGVPFRKAYQKVSVKGGDTNEKND